MLFSVVVPSYNRPDRLAVCLESLANLDFARDQYEVVVADDGSRQSLETVVDAFRGRMQCTLVRQANAGPASARNLAASHARGEFLAFTDDDCVALPGWLSALLEAHRATPDALLGGGTANGIPGNLYAVANQCLTEAVTGWWRDHNSPLNYFPSNNLSAPAALFRQIGGFSLEIPLVAAEDRQLGQNWLVHGWPLRFVPEARVLHYHPQNLRRFGSMHFRYGRGARLFHLNRADGIRGRFPIEGLAFYRHMLAEPFQRGQAGNAWVASALIFLSQIILTCGYAYQAATGSPKQFVPEGR